MRKGTKFMNIDILSAMKGIVDTHAKHYQSDFAYDIAALKEAALKKERAERIFVWMCRKSGTWLLKEKDVFIRDSHEYSVFTYYAEQTRDSILAFVVEVVGADGDTVKGNIYALDYRKHYQHVCRAAVSAGSVTITYEHGQRTIPPTQHFGAYPDYELGAFVSYKSVPESPEQLEMVLTDEKRTRNRFKEDYEVFGCELYECPALPTDSGKYFCKTPILEQAETIVRNAKTNGKQLFIKAVCSDGKQRYL